MKKFIWAVVVLAILALILYAAGVFDRKFLDSEPIKLTVRKIQQITEEVGSGNSVLMDVRTVKEREDDGYAVDSFHFDLARLEKGEMPDISKDKMIYIYCKGGVRAGKALEILRKNGFSRLENIGGLVDWEKAGGEVRN